VIVRKEIIRPGLYWYMDQQTGLPRKLKATADTIKHFHESGKAMLAAGLTIPAPLEHQPSALPLTAAERAARQLLNNAGDLKDFEVGELTEKDAAGKPVVVKDVLFGQVDIQDAAVTAKLGKTIRWTSPYISSFTDGNGKRWDGVITHLALTSRPRIVKQQPFESIAAAMSFAATQKESSWGANLIPRDKGITLSRAGLLAGDGEDLHPVYPIAFAHWSGGIALASDDMPEKKSDDKPAATPPEGLDKAPEKALVDAEGDISVYDVICDLLECEGYSLPEGTSKDNFAERMYTALMDKKKGSAMEPDKTPPMTTPAPKTPPPVVQEQHPAYMSLEQAKEKAKAVTDPALRELLQAALSMQEGAARQTEALRKNAFAQAKNRRDQRIEELCRRVRTPAFRDKIVAQAGAAAFSMSDDGMVQDSLSPMLETLEAGIRDLPTLLTTPAEQLRELAHPQEYQGDVVTTERAKAVADEFCSKFHIG